MTENTWQRYPSDINKRALDQKPGLMGVQYAFPKTESFTDHLNHLRVYLDKWEESPIKTDRQYFQKIFRNIVFQGMRSR